MGSNMDGAYYSSPSNQKENDEGVQFVKGGDHRKDSTKEQKSGTQAFISLFTLAFCKGLKVPWLPIGVALLGIIVILLLAIAIILGTKLSCQRDVALAETASASNVTQAKFDLTTTEAITTTTTEDPSNMFNY